MVTLDRRYSAARTFLNAHVQDVLDRHDISHNPATHRADDRPGQEWLEHLATLGTLAHWVDGRMRTVPSRVETPLNGRHAEFLPTSVVAPMPVGPHLELGGSS